MRKRDNELSKGWGQIVTPLSMDTAGGKQMLNCANAQGLLRIIQSIPSPKAEPFKLWLAQVGSDRLQEIENPELATQRTRELYKAKGYSDDWIEKRMRSIAIRFSPTLQSVINNNGCTIPELIGDYTICYSTNGTTYSLQNGGNSVSWNVSSNLQILSSSNTSITVRPTNSSTIGAEFVEAVLPMETIREDIWIGVHKPIGFVSVIVDPWLGRIKARVEPVQDATGYVWYLDGVQYTGPGMNSDYVTIPIPRNNCTIPDYSIGVKAINTCGTSAGYFELHENPCYEGEYYYSYSPNPVSKTLTVERVNQSDSKSNNNTISTIHQYKLHDFNGNVVQEGNLSTKTEIDVSKLLDGRYILVIQIDKNNRETHHIIIN